MSTEVMIWTTGGVIIAVIVLAVIGLMKMASGEDDDD